MFECDELTEVDDVADWWVVAGPVVLMPAINYSYHPKLLTKLKNEDIFMFVVLQLGDRIKNQPGESCIKIIFF